MATHQILIMTTDRPALRSEAQGWTAEDPSLLREGPIGFTPGFPESYCYPTPMHALAAGWRLLAPPTQQEGGRNPDTGETWQEWEWWMVRDGAASRVAR